MLKIRDEEADLRAKPSTLTMKAVPRYLCSHQKSFVICGSFLQYPLRSTLNRNGNKIPSFSLRHLLRPSKIELFRFTGGLGGFGLELADWLVLRGARKLVLTSRKGITSGYQAMRIRIWRSYGTEVVISTDDITREEGVQKLLRVANTLGPVSAIFNLAVVNARLR